MSVLLDVRKETHEAVPAPLITTTAATGASARGQAARCGAALIAGFLITYLVSRDLSLAAFAAVEAAALACITPAGSRRGARRLDGAVVLTVAGLVAALAAGALLHRSGGSGATATGGVLTGWAALVVLATPGRGRRQSRHDAATVLRLATTGAAFIAVLLLVALVSPSTRASAGVVGVAAPPALLVLLAALSAIRSAGVEHPRVRLLLATCAATAAGVLLGASTLARSRPITTGSLVASLAVTLAAAAVLHVLRSGGGRSGVPHALVIGGGLATGAFGAGLGPGVVPLIGLAAGVITLTDWRPASAPARLAPAAETDVAVTRLRTALTLIGLSAVGFGLRVLVPRGLWLDEATSVHQARLSMSGMLHLLYSQDNHPPLYQMILWVNIRLVGDSELALRLPSMVIGVLLIPMLYVTGRELFGRRTAMVAAVIGTVAPVAIWYAQEARMYSLFMLLALTAVWAQVRALRTGKRRYWVIFTLTSAALVWTQYFASLHVVAQQVVFAFHAWRTRRQPQERRRFLVPWLVSLAVIAVLVLPLAPVALHQFAHNQQAGFGFNTHQVATGSAVVPKPSIYGLFTNMAWGLWGYQPDRIVNRLVALWPIGMLIVLVMLGRARHLANRYLAVLAGIPTLAVFLASLGASKSRSLAEVRYFAGAVPILFLLVAALITTLAKSRLTRGLLVGGVVITMLAGLVGQDLSRNNPRVYGYREALHTIARDARPGDRLVYEPHYLDYVLEYYSPRMPASSLDDGLAKVAHSKRVFLFSSLSFADSGQSAAAAQAAIAKLQKRLPLRHTMHFDQATVWEFG